jgi:hypothetical protein
LKANFGRQNDVVARAALGDELADQLLALTAGIDVGGVDEVAARPAIGVEDRPRCRFVGSPFARPKRHRSQGERAYDKARAAQRAEIGKRHQTTFIAINMKGMLFLPSTCQPVS